MFVRGVHCEVKSLAILFCSLSLLLTCHAALNQRYLQYNLKENAPYYFAPHFESQLFTSFPGNTRSKEDIGKLTTSLLHDIHVRAGKNFNVVISPVSVWMVLAMLLEGAAGRTESELKAKLQLSYGSHGQGQQILRARFKELNAKARKSPTEFTSLNFVVSSKERVINPGYGKTISQFYNGRHFEVGSGESEELSRMINTWGSETTKNRIRAIVSPAMLTDFLLVIGNAAYFKSEWKHPFDPSQTILLPFKDEFEKPIKSVPMMNQVAVLPYAYSWQLESEILEIPYADDSTSMIVILPREKLSLRKVLSKMRYLSLDQIIPKNFTEETIQVFLPRFQIQAKLYLNEILQRELKTVFSPREAEFPHIGQNVFVSKVFHRAEIENTEEGTVASAVSSVQFAYKSSSVMFKANRPFIYLITEMKTKTVLFAGTYSNPFVG